MSIYKMYFFVVITCVKIYLFPLSFNNIIKKITQILILFYFLKQKFSAFRRLSTTTTRVIIAIIDVVAHDIFLVSVTR